MNKTQRQTQILQLIRKKRIHTQDELAKELAALGTHATQVTLSRDMRDLRLAKTADGYVQLLPAGPKAPEFATVAAEFLGEVRLAQNLVVLRTSPGNANAVAVALDREDWPGVVGTIAGDDTVVVIAPDSKTAVAVCERIAGFVK
jgi:transcriptional regulator of arginine metabolism